MVRLNDQKNRECFCVPTYDIDLVWHTHQLDPISYSKDMTENVGRVCHHNDKVSDRTPGKLLHVGFCDITDLWEQTYGRSYWTAGSLHRGTPPAPVTRFPVNFIADKKLSSLNKSDNPIQFPSLNVVEVLLEFVEIKNLPAGHGNLTVYFSKKQADKIFKTKRSLRISSELGEKQVASFHCEPKGEFLFELMSNSAVSNKPKLLGSYLFSLQELVASGSQLATDTWLSLEPVSGNITSSETILLHTSISYTPPVPAPIVFRLAGSSQPFPIGKDAKIPRQVTDLDGKRLFTLDMRNIEKDVTKCTPDVTKEVYCITDSGEKHRLAEFVGNHWSIKGSNGSLKLQNSSGNDDSLFELVGCKMVKFYPGRRLDFEAEIPLEKQTLEHGFMTAVEFSVEKPYGKAIALIDFKSETMKATEEWMILPGITVAYLVTEILKEEIDFKAWNTIQGCDHLDMVQMDGFADCAKCYQCGVLAGGENDGMAGGENYADLGNMLKTDGAASCATCHLCTGRLTADKFADCANCYQCGVKSGGGNDIKGDFGGVVGGGGEIGNMENYADLGNKFKTDGAASCATCHLCTGRLAADKFADCAKCYQCGVKSGDGDDGNGDN
ncbi:glycine-rich domain-containing protein 1-like [Silene latifolia]|uniref:glycine-rich domain-containing protein 1-like n=1 Tax=Silene latifolia TaxID=37657 RepID=UPI003D775839